MAYHPQTNGLVELFHWSMDVSLKARCLSPSWKSELHWGMLSLRIIPKDNLGTSPAELVFRSPLMVPGWFVGHDLDELVFRISPPSMTLQCIFDWFLQYTMPLPQPQFPHFCLWLSSSSFVKMATSCSYNHLTMAHFAYWPQGTHPSKFRSVIVRRPF